MAGYLLEEEIGAGGMAVVFRARDERLDRPVALKVLAPGLAADEEFRRRFLREARAAAAVDDPHIIPVYEAGEADGVLFLAMRLVSGGDVRALLRREGPLPPDRVAAILSPVASALDAAHGAGLVHRDVKPANMLIDARSGRPDHVYVSDFGLAKAGSASALTGTGLMLGTAAYMAPEQIQGQVVDGRADQYALGCAAFELLCGAVPFVRDQDVAVIYAHLSVPPPSAAGRCPGLPPEVDEVLSRALAKAPEDRYASCGGFAEALRAALGLPGYDRDRRAASAQVTVAARGDAPPAALPDAFAGNLPVQLSSFVGRAGELAGLAAAVRAWPLVTVTGPGGVGKTRLALRAAADLLPSFSDGVWLCELAPAADGEAMAQAVAGALRVRPRPGLSTAGSVVEFLRTRSGLLLVLDNCEHLAAAAAALAADILRGCPGVRILATSQQPLGVGGEQVFGLRPLSLPPPEATMAAAGASEAVSLFVQRAAAARGDFSLGPANVAAVGEICRRLDGIPLAIELAAARVAALRPAEIAGLLDERFRLLTRGRADAARRQQTLQATLEWSYGLLSESDRRVFDALGTFPASFDAEAAVAVADAGGLQKWDVIDGLTTLVGQSLVVPEEGPDQASRYRLLETMRAYARQQLAAASEYDGMRYAHAEHYAAFAERAGLELLGPAQLDWQLRIQAELDNLQAAVTWGLADGGQTSALAFRIVAALGAFAVSSPSTVGGWAEACLAQISACPPELRGLVIVAAAYGAFFAGDVLLARRRAEDALRNPASSDPFSLALLRGVLAQACALTGQPERGASIAKEGRREAEEQGIEILVGYFHADEAMAWTAAGDYAAARRPAMEAVEVARRVQNPALSAFAFCTAAGAIWPSDPQAALALIEDSLALTLAGAFDTFLGITLTWAGFIRARTGDLPGALAVLQEAVAQQHVDGNRLLLGLTLEVGAVVLARLGEAEPAAVLSGAFAAHFPPGLSPVPKEQMEIGEAQSLARRALGEAAYSAALGRGTAMGEDEVVEYAQGEFRRLAALRAEPGAQAPD